MDFSEILDFFMEFTEDFLFFVGKISQVSCGVSGPNLQYYYSIFPFCQIYYLIWGNGGVFGNDGTGSNNTVTFNGRSSANASTHTDEGIILNSGRFDDGIGSNIHIITNSDATLSSGSEGDEILDDCISSDIYFVLVTSESGTIPDRSIFTNVDTTDDGGVGGNEVDIIERGFIISVVLVTETGNN